VSTNECCVPILGVGSLIHGPADTMTHTLAAAADITILATAADTLVGGGQTTEVIIVGGVGPPPLHIHLKPSLSTKFHSLLIVLIESKC